jgi:hypothetical protein
VEGAFNFPAWLDAIRRGRTFMSTGPLLFMTVNGRQPGDEIAVAANASPAVRVRVEALSIAPMDSVQIIVNGQIAHTTRATDKLAVNVDTEVQLPNGGWVTARALGPHSNYIGDDYAFAQTSPVYIVRGGRRFVDARDVQFLTETVDAIWTRVERSRWRSDAERDRFRAGLDSARAVYRRLAATATPR